MSAKPHKFWPSVGSVWSHWSDLLLATQLAALRAGFNYVGKTWDPASPAYLKLRCQVEAHARRKNRCRHALVGAAPADPQDPSGAWTVTAVTATNLEARRHPSHCNGIGLSRRLKKKPAGRGALGPGDVITGFRDLHTLEGSLRADARRTGRFLSFGAVPKTECDLEFKCVLGTATCPFRVRLRETGEPGEEPQWRCLEIKRTHTCVSGASVPQDRLKRRLDFFPSVQLEDGCLGKPTRIPKSRATGRVSKADKHIGPFPVRARPSNDQLPTVDNTAPRAYSSVPLVPAADDDSSASKKPDPLDRLRVALSSAEQELAESAAVAEELKGKVAAMEKLVEVHRKRVDKKRKKLQRKVERAQRKKVKDGGRSRDKKRDVQRGKKREREGKGKIQTLVLSDSE